MKDHLLVLLVNSLILGTARVGTGRGFVGMGVPVLLELGVDLGSLHVVGEVHETVDLLCVLTVVGLLLPVVVGVHVRNGHGANGLVVDLRLDVLGLLEV